MEISKALRILGVSEWELNEASLKKAYRVASRKAHPDVVGGSNERFISVQEAYKDLCRYLSRHPPVRRRIHKNLFEYKEI